MSLEDKWASLDKKLDGILRNQSYIIQKILLMQNQLDQLSTAAPAKGDVPKPKEVFQPVTDKEIIPSIEKAPAPKEQETPAAKTQEVVTPKAQEVIEKPIQKVAMQAPITPPKAAASASKDTREPVIEWSKLIKKADWERFIGGNLFNKIGIAIILIGVFIGVKYSIDHDLISPTMRIILGYLTGGALFGVGYYLKPKYEKFSAVLVSGAMAIFYFLTYVAYDFYQMYPIGQGCYIIIL